MTDRPQQISRYIDGDLPEQEFAELQSWLVQSPAHARQFMLWIALDRRIGEIERRCRPMMPVTAKPSTHIADRKTVRTRMTGACLLLAASVGIVGVAAAIWGLVVDRPPSKPDVNAGPIVAALIDSTGDVFVNGDFVSPGSSYLSGTYSIDSGEANFLLTNQVGVKLTGNAALVMHSDVAATMIRGTAEFRCPPGTEGYTVHLPGGARVVDLGTEFGVQVHETGQRVRVLDGRVRAEARDATARELSVGQQIRFVNGRFVGEVEPMLPLVEGPVRWAAIPPPAGDTALATDAEPHPILLIPERRDVKLTEPLHVGIWPPIRRAGEIPAGKRVDSFLLHLDPRDNTPLRRTATFRFDRPVLGLIFGSGLAGTDALLAIPGRTDLDYYDRAANDGDTPDRFALSDDRRTLTVQLIAFSVDQVRIIVEAETTTPEQIIGPNSP